MSESSRKKILIICIDRDNDLGQKAGISGPFIGRKSNIEAATRLALKDPEDSDINAIFKSVQVYDDLKSREDVEIVTLTGDRSVGMESDREILRQLDTVLDIYPADEAILISDGAEDEYVTPLLRTKISLVYPKKVIIKQNENLENTYYMIYDFFNKVMNDPKAARFFLGLPAIALLIYAIMGADGIRVIMGTIGLYLMIKGFQLESTVDNIKTEILTSVRMRRSSFFMYLVGLAFLILGAFSGYNHATSIEEERVLYLALNFIEDSIIYIFLGILLIGWGGIHARKNAKLHEYISYLAVTFSIALVLHSIARYLLAATTYMDIVYSVVIGGVLLTISSIIENLEKKRERRRKSK